MVADQEQSPLRQELDVVGLDAEVVAIEERGGQQHEPRRVGMEAVGIEAVGVETGRRLAQARTELAAALPEWRWNQRLRDARGQRRLLARLLLGSVGLLVHGPLRGPISQAAAPSEGGLLPRRPRNQRSPSRVNETISPSSGGFASGEPSR